MCSQTSCMVVCTQDYGFVQLYVLNIMVLCVHRPVVYTQDYGFVHRPIVCIKYYGFVC